MTIELNQASYIYPGAGSGIRDVSLNIAQGELLAVIGPSGCGKSTILKLIAGFLTPQSGQVKIKGKDATNIAPRHRNLGIVFQDYALFPHMTLAENIAYPLKLRGVSKAEIEQRVTESLSMVGLKKYAERGPRAMSGGQRQRIALARALVFRPQALLLDEPLSALDATLRVEMRDEITRLQKLYGVATLHITHDQEEALSMADRVAVMRDGRILQVGSPKEIYDHPATKAVAAFVGHANLLEATILDATHVMTSIGRLTTGPHRYDHDASVSVLIRPERINCDQINTQINLISGQITRDRFLGSLRRFDFRTDDGTVLTVESQGSFLPTSIQIPPEAIQIVDSNPDSS